MKKIGMFILVAFMAISFTACAPKEMPTDKMEADYVLGTTLDEQGLLQIEVGEEYTYKLTMPVEEGTVTAVKSDNPLLKAHFNSDTQELTLLAKEAVEGAVEITLEAKGYASTSITIKVAAQPKTLDLGLQLADEEGNPIFFEGDVLRLPVNGTAKINLEAPDNTEFALETTADTVKAVIEDGVLMVTPTAVDAGEVEITASNGTSYEQIKRDIKVVGMDTINISLSKQELKLLPNSSESISISANTASTLEANVLSGDAKAVIAEGKIQITGGTTKSIIEVRAQAEGWISGTKQITVQVQQPEVPKAPEKVVEQPEAVPEKAPVTTPSEDKKPSVDKPEQIPTIDVDTSDYDDDIAGIVKYTNMMREEAGLPKLEHVKVVDIPATLRAEEASERWSHTRPNGEMYYTIFEETGLSYGTNGENLFMANAYLSPKKVVEEWMDSPGHRENILRKEFTGIGVGCFEVNGEVFWTQLFVG